MQSHQHHARGVVFNRYARMSRTEDFHCLNNFQSPFAGDVQNKPQDVEFCRRVGAGNPQLVLDVGCGPHCQASCHLRSLCSPFVLCTDVNMETVEQGKSKLQSGADGVVANMEHLPLIFRPGVFDVVLCFYSLQHTRSPTRTALGFATLPSPGGAVAVAAMCDQCRTANGGVDKLPDFLLSCYKSFLAPRVLPSLLESAGLEADWCREREQIYETEGEFPCLREYVVARKPVARVRMSKRPAESEHGNAAKGTRQTKE